MRKKKGTFLNVIAVSLQKKVIEKVSKKTNVSGCTNKKIGKKAKNIITHQDMVICRPIGRLSDCPFPSLFHHQNWQLLNYFRFVFGWLTWDWFFFPAFLLFSLLWWWRKYLEFAKHTKYSKREKSKNNTKKMLILL